MSLHSSRILWDASQRVGMTEHELIVSAAKHTEGFHDPVLAEKMYRDEELLPQWLEDFCLDVLTGRRRIPEPTLKAKNLLVGGLCKSPRNDDKNVMFI